MKYVKQIWNKVWDKIRTQARDQVLEDIHGIGMNLNESN